MFKLQLAQNLFESFCDFRKLARDFARFLQRSVRETVRQIFKQQLDDEQILKYFNYIFETMLLKAEDGVENSSK